MKKKLVVLTMLITCLFSMMKVHASRCGDEELAKINEDASKVKVDYEIAKKTIPNPDDPCDDCDYQENVEIDVVRVRIINLTDKLYIKLTNTKDNSVKTFTAADAKDGVISYDIQDLSTLAKINYVLYTTSNTSCSNEEVLKYELNLPRYNADYNVGPCMTKPDAPECQKFVTTEHNENDYNKLVNKEEKKAEEEKEKSKKNKNESFIEENKKEILIGGSIIVLLGVVTTAVVIKKRRSRLI